MRRSRLLALGWALAALLPLVGGVLIAANYASLQHAQTLRSRLVADGIEHQLRDHLYLLGRELDGAPLGDASKAVIPVRDVVTRPATAAELADPFEMRFEQIRGERGPLRVTKRHGSEVTSATIDPPLFADVLEGYPLGPGDFVGILEGGDTLIAGSLESAELDGRRIVDPMLTRPAYASQAEGSYAANSRLDGRGRSHFFRRLDGLPLTIIVGSDRQSLFGLWVRPALAIFGIALLMAAAWGWLVHRFDDVQGAQSRLIERLEATLRALQTGEERLRQATELAMLGEYEWDPTSDHVAFSGESARIYDFDAGRQVFSLEEVFARVHPDDRAALAARGELIGSGQHASVLDLRIVRPDGSERRVLTRARLVTAEDGRRVVRGVQQDITEITQARERARRAEAEYRFLFEHNPLPMWVFNRESLTIVAVNDAMLAHYGYTREELVGASMLSIRPAHDAEALGEAALADAAERPQGCVWTHLHKDGRHMRMAIFSHDIAFEGRVARLVAAQDVTEREQAEQRFQMVAKATSDAIYDYDLITGAIWWSESYYARFGDLPTPADTAEEWAVRVHPADQERVVGGLREAVTRSDTEWEEQYRYRRADGSYASVLDRAFIQRDDAGQALRMVGGMLDMSELQSYEERLAYRATHDELTDLPNRQLLHDRLQQALLNAQRYGRDGVLIFVDLDDFKLVNDTLGHTAGDQVLCEVAARLQSVARETDTVARFGGDEFVIVLTEQLGDSGALEVIHRINEALARPIDTGSSQQTLTASIGWCRFPEAGTDVETLLKHGDVAMHQAKRQGRNRAVPFQNEFVEGVSRRVQLVAELRRGLEHDEFVPVFQPLFDGLDRPVALETLVRWRHPERGLLLPGDFIPVCEESGLIVELGRRVLDQAARHYRLLADAGLPELRVAVNVSPAQFTDDLVNHVRDTIRTHRLPVDVLELEITEGLLMQDPERAIELMRQIASMGVSFSIDDFGTGYSSLAYLKRFPIDRLKIDRSFVRDLGSDDDDAAICNSIIGLAHALDIRTVAEGVETSMQLDWLRARHIDEVQGYLLARPMPFDELLPLLMRYVERARVAAL